MSPLKILLSIAALWLWLSAVVHAGTVTYVYSDPQGTPLAEADANGTITATFDYRPYGVQALGTAPNGPGYTGHVNDPDTGLVYMQARYYDPAVGRFISVDPAGPSAGGVFGFNRFAYVDNNPVVRIDPDGRVSAATDAAAERQRHASDEVKKARERAESGSLAEKEAGIGAFQTLGGGVSPTLSQMAGTLSNAVGTGLNVTDVALSAYMLRAPKQLGNWQMGNLAVSRYVGATWQDMTRFANVGKVANGVSFLAIGSSSFSLVAAARNGDRIGAIGAGADLGWSLFGLTGPVGAVGSTAYGVTSLLVNIPAVNKLTVQPVSNAMCMASPNCR